MVKNKVAPPFKIAEFDILYGHGISKTGEVVDRGVETGVMDKSGSWYYYNGERVGQGRDNARKFLETNPEILAEIEEKIKALGTEQEEELDIRLLDMSLDE